MTAKEIIETLKKEKKHHQELRDMALNNGVEHAVIHNDAIVMFIDVFLSKIKEK